MGDFKISIQAAGGHGCERTAKDGEDVTRYCNRLDCPDCLTRQFVESLKQKFPVAKATFTHWPGSPNEVVDDLLTRKRTGSF